MMGGWIGFGSGGSIWSGRCLVGSKNPNGQGMELELELGLGLEGLRIVEKDV